MGGIYVQQSIVYCIPTCFPHKMTNNPCMFILFVCLFSFQEFVVQHNENVNPPTFFLTLDVMLQLMTKDDNVIRCEGGRKEGKRGRGGV